MNQLNYKASIAHEIYTLVQENPSWTMGEILHSFTHKGILGKSLVTASDEELYTALEKSREFETEETE